MSKTKVKPSSKGSADKASTNLEDKIEKVQRVVGDRASERVITDMLKAQNYNIQATINAILDGEPS